MDPEVNVTVPDNDIPPEVWSILHQFLLGINDPDLDLRQPHFKVTFTNIYAYVIFAYALLVVAGVTGNAVMLLYIIRNKLYKDEIYTFLLNNVISDMVKCLVVLPISVYVLLVQNWVLGEMLCSFLPMIQDIPLHTSTLTFVLLAWDRFRYVRKSTTARFPALVCSIGTWLTSGCLVLPYPIYIIYIDLGEYFRMSTFQGVGLCTVNLADDMKEYMRWIFFLMYVGPLILISYMFIRISRELQNSWAIATFQSRLKERSLQPRNDSHSTNADFRNSRSKLDRHSQYSRSSCSDLDHAPINSGRAQYETPARDCNLNCAKEIRIQRFLVVIVTAYGLCLCPLMVLRLARLALIETYDNSGHFDITYAIFVWVAFAPTFITPMVFGAWQTSGSRMDKLRGYFRFSNHKFRHSCETVMTTTMGTPPVPSQRFAQRHGSQPDTEVASDTNSSHHETNFSHNETNNYRHENKGNGGDLCSKDITNEAKCFQYETNDHQNESKGCRRGCPNRISESSNETSASRCEFNKFHRETGAT